MCVEILSIICHNIIHLKTNVLRFAVSEVILTFSRNALCAFVFYISAIHQYDCMYQNCMSRIAVIVNIWGKLRVYINLRAAIYCCHVVVSADNIRNWI